jgi:ribosome-binding protein aMBF1 (putative translation factor)
MSADAGRDHQDWETVTFTKISKSPDKIGAAKYAHAKKLAALDDPDYTPPKLDKSNSKTLQSSRLSKKMSQKDIASKLNVKAAEVQLWESGKKQIPGDKINKINQILNINLRSMGTKKPVGTKGILGPTNTLRKK